MSVFVYSQILAGIGLAVGLTAVQFKERRSVLLGLFVLTLFNASHFFLLEKQTAAVLLLLVGLRYLVAIVTTKRPVLYLFLFVSVVSFIVTFQGPLSVLSMVAVLLGTYGSFQPTDRVLRIYLMLGNVTWLLHNILALTPVGILMEACFLTSNLIGYWRFYRKSETSRA